MDCSLKNKKVKFGEDEIEVDNDFKLFFTSPLSNPRYEPDIQGSTLVINYSVTFQGLIEQLLNEVVKNERPELEKQRKDLIDSTSKNKSKLAELEEKILRELNLAASSNQPLIENEDLIKMLDDIKKKVEEINEKLKIAEKTTIEINEAREVYRDVATRGAILFFVVNSLLGINSMYEYSLDSYMKDIFCFSLKKSEYSSSLNGRLDNIIEFLTKRTYEYVCAGLFEKDKLTFSMLITTKILENKGDINSKELDFFIKGNISLEKVEKNPFTWLAQKNWKDLVKLNELNTVFENIIRDVKNNENEWKNWFDSEQPESSEIPNNYSKRLSMFQKLCLLRCFRTDRILRSVTKFITVSMNSNFFVSPPILDYKKIFKESTNLSPLLCMIQKGYDPFCIIN